MLRTDQHRSAPTASTSERTVTSPANRRTSRLLAPVLVLALLGAAVVIALAPVPQVVAQLTVGALLVLAAVVLARIGTGASRAR